MSSVRDLRLGLNSWGSEDDGANDCAHVGSFKGINALKEGSREWQNLFVSMS